MATIIPVLSMNMLLQDLQLDLPELTSACVRAFQPTEDESRCTFGFAHKEQNQQLPFHHF